MTKANRYTAKATIATPLGAMLLARTARGLAGAWFDDQKHHPGAIDAPERADDPLLADVTLRLVAAMASRRAPRDALAGLALDLGAGTPFQQSVWRALARIPCGTTTTYGAIARELGRPQAVRAVGAAIGRNPVSVLVPCHRVVGHGGALTGYAGGLPRKQALLALEGAAAGAAEGDGRMTMKPAHLGELVLLAALWGASFLFMRLGAGEFGPVALTGLRVAGAALVLLPLVAWRGALPALRTHWKPIAVVGVANSAIPFVAFGVGALSLDAGLLGIFNAAAPLFAALIAVAWFGERPGPWRVAGLAIGFAGVAGLAAAKGGVGGGGTALAIGACLAATVAYGWAANYTRAALGGIPPIAVAAGSQLAAAVALALPTAWLWPAAPPSPQAWAALGALAVLCTAWAYLLYFRLIAHVGAGNAITVTYLIPAFAMAWGGLFLGERLSGAMLAGCAVILAGTALATGLVAPRAARRTA